MTITSTGSAQTPAVEVRMSDMSVEQCRRGQTSYELDLEGRFDLRNVSSETILVARNVDAVSSVTAADSLEELKNHHYSFVMSQEFGGNTPIPRLEELTRVKPGETTSIRMGVVLPATTNPQETGKNRLSSRKYWVQLEFSTIPFSLWSQSDRNAWKIKWKSNGTFLSDYFLTEPFLFDVVPNEKARNCNSKVQNSSRE